MFNTLIFQIDSIILIAVKKMRSSEIFREMLNLMAILFPFEFTTRKKRETKLKGTANKKNECQHFPLNQIRDT